MSTPNLVNTDKLPDAPGTPTDTTERRERRRLVERWGAELLEPGWVALPAIILEKQAALELDALDLNIIMHLARRWFDADQPPSPGKQGIADAILCDPRTVQRRMGANPTLYGSRTRTGPICSYLPSDHPRSGQKLRTVRSDSERGRRSG